MLFGALITRVMPILYGITLGCGKYTVEYLTENLARQGFNMPLTSNSIIFTPSSFSYQRWHFIPIFRIFNLNFDNHKNSVDKADKRLYNFLHRCVQIREVIIAALNLCKIYSRILWLRITSIYLEGY